MAGLTGAPRITMEWQKRKPHANGPLPKATAADRQGRPASVRARKVRSIATVRARSGPGDARATPMERGDPFDGSGIHIRGRPSSAALRGCASGRPGSICAMHPAALRSDPADRSSCAPTCFVRPAAQPRWAIRAAAAFTLALASLFASSSSVASAAGTEATGDATGSAPDRKVALDVRALVGEWYVLVHTRPRPDGDAAETDGAQSYRDAVWRFELEGGRLRWTIYPELDFRDESGRYEVVRGERARIHHAWRPTQSQLEEIRSGLSVVERNARTKTLRPDDSGTWRSTGAARLGSASSVAYGEQWRIEPADSGPVFVRSASLRSGRAASLEGTTRFDAVVFEADGGWIEGRYARDERERGRFYMWRKGATSERDRAFAVASADASLFGPGGAARMPVEALMRRIESGDGSRANREAIRAGIRELVEESYTRRGLALPPRAGEIDALVSEIERLAVVEGVPLVEIDRRFAAGELSP